MLEKFGVFQIAKLYHWRCKDLKIRRNLQTQLLRASSSVARNLAKGSEIRTFDDKLRFYSIALGSLRECQAISYAQEDQDPVLTHLGNQLGAMLDTLSGQNFLKITENFPSGPTSELSEPFELSERKSLSS